MRKLVSLGLFALMFSMFSGNVFADIEDCEQVKGEKKGLYGLCIAYWSTTNAKARAKILSNFEKNAGGDGIPGMPGLNGAECDCWTADHVLEAIEVGSLASYMCDGPEASLDVVNVYSGNTFSFFAFPASCFFVHPKDMVPPTPYESEETEKTCRAGLHVIIKELVGDDCAD